MLIKDIIGYLEQLAPVAYQESYDNSGLLVGESNWQVNGILITLDATEAVVEEAIKLKCNLVIAHHPIIFKGLKKLNGKNYVERTVIKAIKHDIAIYAIHTNLDNVAGGVNFAIARKIGLHNVKILSPKKQLLQKLVSFVPTQHTMPVLEALYNAGAGNIGNYSNCSFRTAGTGTFLPDESANPHIGEKNKLEEVQEERIELIFPAHISPKIIQALRKAHPYEEVAYYLTNLENEYQDTGSGAIGELPQPMAEMDFLMFLKEKMNLGCIRYTPLRNIKISRIALCGGTGSFLLPDAIRQQADVFITADVKYHEFFDADKQLIIADIGHFESEAFTKELIYNYLSEKFTNIALILSKTVTNPINYL